jgi:hypothetical protein
VEIDYEPETSRISITGSVSSLPLWSAGWLGSSQEPWVPRSARRRCDAFVPALDGSNLS